MAKVLQPYASFTIEDNRVHFFKNEIAPIDSMLTDNGTRVSHVIRNVNAFYYS